MYDVNHFHNLCSGGGVGKRNPKDKNDELSRRPAAERQQSSLRNNNTSQSTTVPTEIVIMAMATPILANRIKRIIDGNSASSAADDVLVAPDPLLFFCGGDGTAISVSNGVTIGASVVFACSHAGALLLAIFIFFMNGVLLWINKETNETAEWNERARMQRSFGSILDIHSCVVTSYIGELGCQIRDPKGVEGRSMTRHGHILCKRKSHCPTRTTTTMMMKTTVAVLLVSIISPVATAFAPSQNAVSSTTITALRAAAEPMGIAKFPGFVGKTEWNRLTTEWGTADTGVFLQAA
jgi:hypothetical protein